MSKITVEYNTLVIRTVEYVSQLINLIKLEINTYILLLVNDNHIHISGQYL